MGSPGNRENLFHGGGRQFYDLERMWKDAAEVDLSGVPTENQMRTRLCVCRETGRRTLFVPAPLAFRHSSPIDTKRRRYYNDSQQKIVRSNGGRWDRMNDGKGGLGFWGVVGAVLVALIIFALC